MIIKSITVECDSQEEVLNTWNKLYAIGMMPKSLGDKEHPFLVTFTGTPETKVREIPELDRDVEFELLDTFSCAYFGRKTYQKSVHGMVYSKHSNRTLTRQEAIDEFVSMLRGKDV